MKGREAMKKLRKILSFALVLSIFAISSSTYIAHASSTYNLSAITLHPGYVMHWDRVTVTKNCSSRFYIKTNAQGLTLSIGFKKDVSTNPFQDYFFGVTPAKDFDTGWIENQLDTAGWRPFVCNHTPNVVAEIYDGSYVEYN